MTPNLTPDSHPLHIALFGGTFDPVHEGHLVVAQHAVEEHKLDRVIFLPCRQSPHKEQTTGANEDQRLEMLRRATQDHPWAEVSAWEYQQPLPSYSWRAAEAFCSAYPQSKLFWLMGWDQWKVIETWDCWPYFLELVQAIVHDRAEEGTQEFSNEENAKPSALFVSGNHPASASELRHHLQQGGPLPVELQAWLHPKVLSFIQEKELYQST